MDPITFRRHIHRHPELSFQEMETAKYISDALTELGVPHRPIAKTGILAKIEGKGEINRALVLRADIDALPVEEASGVEFASENKGVMHACGHDMHAAVLFGVAQHFAANRDFEGTILLLFQPGEELNPGGASLVLAEEPFADYNIIAVVGEHVEYSLPVGTLGFREGKYMASSDEIRFNVKGVGGHGAMRWRIKDPVQAAAAYTLKLLELNSEELILSIGKVLAHGATNVIPESVFLEGTMRTFDEGVRSRTKERLHQIAADVNEKYGVEIEVMISHGFPCVVNDRELTAIAREEATKNYDVIDLDLRTTSEDFGFYTTRYPSLFYRLGAGREGCGAPHTSTFNPSEEAIGVGVDFMISLATKILKDEKR
ncbi:MAG: M20 family metallopeptidase [Rikenellaceae bacterium]